MKIYSLIVTLFFTFQVYAQNNNNTVIKQLELLQEKINELENSGKLIDAISVKKKQLIILEDNLTEDYKLIYGQNLNSIANSYYAILNLDSAIVYAEKAIDVLNTTSPTKSFNSTNIQYEIFTNKILFANIKWSKNELKSALKEYKKIEEEMKLFLEADFNQVISYYYNNLLTKIAYIYVEVYDFKTASLYYEKSLNFNKKNYGISSDKYIYESLLPASGYYHKIGQHNKNIELFEKVLETNYINVSDKNLILYVILMSNYIQISDFEKSMSIIIQLDKYFNNNENMRYEIVYMVNKVEYYMRLEDFAQVDLLYNKMLNISSIIYEERTNKHAEYLIKYAGFLGMLKKYEKGVKVMEQAFSIFKENDIINIDYIKNYGILLAMQSHLNDEEALEKKYSEYINIRNEYIITNLFWMNESQRKSFWINFNTNVTNFMLTSALKNEKDLSRLVLDDVLFKKSLLLKSKNSIDNAIHNSENQDLKYGLIEYKNAKLLISSTNNYDDYIFLKSKIDSLELLFINNLSEINDFYTSMKTTSTNIQSCLKNNEVSIEFIEHSKDSVNNIVAVILDNKMLNPKLVSICKINDIEQILSNKKIGFKLKYKMISKVFWEPLSLLISEYDTIHYSPAGILNKISFNALIEESEIYAIDKYNLKRYFSTTQICDEDNLELEKDYLALLVGNVNYNKNKLFKNSSTTKELQNELLSKPLLTINNLDRSGWQNLPGTKVEIESIKSILKNKVSKVFLYENLDATENKFKSHLVNDKINIIHLATHGFSTTLEGDNNFYDILESSLSSSGVILSGGNLSWQTDDTQLFDQTGEDGILTGYEISNFNLQSVHLVVLSACETSLGKNVKDEGSYSLAMGFKLAGAQNVISSLWEVPDKETSEMMTLFYTALFEEKLSYYDAFMKAQKTMRNKYPDEPLKWAGFVLIE